MEHSSYRPGSWLTIIPLTLAALLLMSGAALAISWTPPRSASEPIRLEAVAAVPMRVDTSYLGGYASGSFNEALQRVAGELTATERTMIGRYLDKIFVDVLRANGLGRTGRLRVAYERVVRPDGSTRSIRVLAAEAAVGGKLHTAYFFDNDGQPGYFDPHGTSLDARSWTGPLRGAATVTSPFGLQRMHPILERMLPHLGTDFAAPVGTPVYATGDGSVSVAARRGGYGYMVEIQHPNGYATRYAHLSSMAVREGMPVQQGDLIAYTGQSGMVTGPHLHYEVRRHGRPVDPERVLAFDALAREVRYDAAWSEERRALGRLLSRAPTVLQTYTAE